MLNSAAPRKGRFSLGLLFCAVGVVFFLLSWLAPNHYPPWVGFHNEAAMFLALILFFAGSLTAQKSVHLPAFIQVFFASLIGLIWVQWASGLISYSGDALVSSLFLTGVGFAWWLGVRTVFVSDEGERMLVLAAILMVVAACASSGMAGLQWLSHEKDMWFFIAERGTNRPYANLAQPNLLATLLVMGFVFAYLLYLRRHLQTWQLSAIAAWLSFGLIMTESRAGLLSSLCLGIFFLIRVRPAWRVGGWRVIAMWWGLLLIFIGLWRSLNEFLGLLPIRHSVIAVDDERLAIWKQVIAGIAEAPWFGYGWRQTGTAQRAGVELVPGNLPTDYAHNIALDVLAWAGLPLGILLLLLGVWWVLRTIRDLKNSTEFLLFSATIPFLVHSMVEFPFAYAFFLFPISWIFGFLHARQMPRQFRAMSAENRFEKLLPIVGLLSFAILCGLVTKEYLAAEEDFRIMRFEMRKVGARPVDYQAPRLMLLTQLDDLLKIGRLNPIRGMSQIEIERLRKANLSRHWGALDVKYMVALGINGQPAEATKQLREIRALYGPEFYRLVSSELRTLRSEKYPELILVEIE